MDTEINPYIDEKVYLDYHWQRVLKLSEIQRIWRELAPTNDLTNPETVQSLLDRQILPCLPSPSMLETDLTDGWCNHGCAHCCFGSQLGSRVRQIDTDMYLSYVRSAHMQGTRSVELVGGGEPTVHKDIGRIVTALNDMQGMSIGMVTNGDLLFKPSLAPVLNKFKWIRISLDAGDEETYMKTHGVEAGVFEKVKDNVVGAVKVLGRNIGLGYLVIPGINDSCGSMEGAIRFGVDSGAGHIAFRPVIGSCITQEQWSSIASKVSAFKNIFPQISITGGLSQGPWKMVDGTMSRIQEICISRPLVQVIRAGGEVPSCFLKRGQPANQNIGHISSGYDACWARNPIHYISWLSEDVTNCPCPCKFDRTGQAIRHANNNVSRRVSSSVPEGHEHFI